jgi:DisA bacterial checkpoint controller nucleotide-binding
MRSTPAWAALAASALDAVQRGLQVTEAYSWHARGRMRSSVYPPDLARYVVDHWPSEGAPLIGADLLCEAVSVAFQASLTSEEGRPTRFRLLLTPPERLPLNGVPNEGVLRLEFARDRPLTADELRRLSPAAPFESALIGSHVVEGQLRIWGIAHSGPQWLNPTWGGRGPVPNWSYDPILHVTGPGQVAVRCAGKLIGAIERGALVDGFVDVFESDWLPALFAAERELVRREHSALQLLTPAPTEADHSLVGMIGQHMLRRAIQLIRNARNGGMILVVDTAGVGDDGTLGGLRLKYRFAGNEPPRRYRTLLFQILDRVAARTTKASVGWSDFALDDSQELERLERSVFELSRVIGGLAGIDGAVVLDKRLQLVGFGAEVSSDLPSPDRVWRALDLEAIERLPESIENVGTRHRAAYRFAQHHPRGLAIVISHDGGVSFVAQRDGGVVYWEQSVSP